MADFVSLQHGDLTDAANVAFLMGAQNMGDYVHNGLLFQNLNWDDGTFDLTSGKAFLLLDEQYAVKAGEYRTRCLTAAELDATSGHTFDTNQINHVYVNFRTGTNDSPQIEVETSLVSDTDWLRIAELDPDPEVEELTRINPAPNGSFADLEAQTLSISESVTYPDGTTRTGAPLTSASILNNRNDYYDVEADNPQGVVVEAEHAQSADSATSANSAEIAQQATQADVADSVGDLSEQDILNRIDAAGGDTTHLATLTDTDPSRALNIAWSANETYDRYLCTLYLENHANCEVEASVRINGHSSTNYFQTKLLADEERGVKTIDARNEWDVGEILPNAIAISDFWLTCPEPVVKPDYHYPVFAMSSQGTTPANKGSLELTGHLAKSMSQIKSLKIFSDGDATARLTIRGQNIGEQ